MNNIYTKPMEMVIRTTLVAYHESLVILNNKPRADELLGRLLLSCGRMNDVGRLAHLTAEWLPCSWISIIDNFEEYLEVYA
jgi:hypothetical protein